MAPMKTATKSFLFLAIAGLLLAACETPRPAFGIDMVKYADVIEREAASPGDLIRKQAIDTNERAYALAKAHKAIAQSRSGAWSWSQGHASPEAAIDEALQECRQQNQRHEEERPCKLIRVDVYWAAEFFAR
jgi:hypothetical protein